MALGGTARGQSSPLQLRGDNAPPGLSVLERSTGTNAKLDNALLRIKRQAAALTSANRSATVRSGSAAPYVTVDVVAKGDVAAVRTQLEALGFETGAVYRNDIGGRLPVSQIDRAAALSGVLTISVPEKRTRSGLVSSQGDAAQRSKALRETSRIHPTTTQASTFVALDGSGLTIGVISDSFDCQAGKSEDIANGDLPAHVSVLKESSDCLGAGSDEGRAMAQIIHDVAPGASIAFYSPDTLADFAQGIKTLALPIGQVDANGRRGAGARIIVDDLGFLNEPLYQTGLAGAAIDEVVRTHGVAYFTAGGNDANRGRAAYDNNDASFASVAVQPGDGGPRAPLNVGERLLNFDASGGSTLENLPITVSARSTAVIGVYWDQPMTSPNASSSLNLCHGDHRGKQIRAGMCTGRSVIGQPAQLRLYISNSGKAYQGTLRLGLAEGPAPARVHLIVLAGGATIDSHGTDTGTLYGHTLSANAMTLGAADYFSTPYCNSSLRTAALESFSSVGGTPLLFDNDGAALAQADVPRKPDFVAPDGVTTTFFGQFSANTGAPMANIADCRADPDYASYHFYGTSAAAPHAAIAALLWQAEPTATAANLYEAMQASSIDMASGGFDHRSGHGFIQADQALVHLRQALKDASAGQQTP
ncbi:S8 family serine peptidase [Dyella sp. LX-66]|uniref:S8 family peptidase n=1 Tax=unclassified Dyella TaxID=2634549 RepID=UPI001BE04942|nr:MULTISPECIES: S8 family serine peptidase [unclassified Dyella]MBT2116572.1 S8 family serine peptidase [Dyella sp. LX-1]MBT2140485.1 S8 family serine peptidase [Dyella sp. LX-66]